MRGAPRQVSLKFSGLGLYLSRLSRFTILIESRGSKLRCHVHDTGRLDHLLRPGNSIVAYKIVERLGRTTSCDALAALTPESVWAVIDSRVPNRLFAEWFREVVGCDAATLIKEPVVQGARLDFMATGCAASWIIEVKGVNLARNGVGLFPNAPSSRASRHLEVLARLGREGFKPMLTLVALRGDVEVFAPNRPVDRRFAELACALRNRLSIVGIKTGVKTVEDAGEVVIEFRGLAPFRCG